MESNHRGRAYETRLLPGTQRLRRHDLHVRPSAHEADELLLLHSAVRLPGIEPESRTWQARVLPLNHGRIRIVWWRLTRIELVFTGCKPVALPLSYSPVV